MFSQASVCPWGGGKPGNMGCMAKGACVVKRGVCMVKGGCVF